MGGEGGINIRQGIPEVLPCEKLSSAGHNLVEELRSPYVFIVEQNIIVSGAQAHRNQYFMVLILNNFSICVYVCVCVFIKLLKAAQHL